MSDRIKIFSILMLANLCFIRGDEVSDLLQLISNESAAYLSYKLPTDNSHLYTETSKPIQDGGVFNYIIVGAGSAGAVLAKRLSDQLMRRVLLLEAGDDQSAYSDIPAFFVNLQNSKNNWGYFTTSQTHACQGMIDKKCAYPRGKVMGGTSSINALIYARTSPHDHERWTDSGVTGWTWNDVLHYYRRLEHYSLGDWLSEPGYHGLLGPVNIETSTSANPFVNDYFLKANSEVYNTTNDYNGRVKMGAAAMQFTKKDGKRVSSNRAYLSSPNQRLTIKKNAYAYKIVLKNNTAVGVEFMQKGIKYLAKAKNEVIVSAGAINSPQLLMLSGLGPKNELSKHKIPVIVDIPVGENMEDHIGFIGPQFTSDIPITNSLIPLEELVREYLQQGKGKLTDTSTPSVVFYSTDGGPNPDIEIIMLSSPQIISPLLAAGITGKSAQKPTPPTDKFDKDFWFFTMLLNPTSRGTVTLKSNNPADFPNINPNSLSDDKQDDIRRIYKAMKYFEDVLMKAPTMLKINVKIVETILPPCASLKKRSREFWYCQIRYGSHTIFHPTGTCRMGVDSKNSVVDSRLRVHGVGRLRVVDASVIPFEVSGHPNGPVMMIAEKAADMIFWDNLFGPY